MVGFFPKAWLGAAVLYYRLGLSSNPLFNALFSTIGRGKKGTNYDLDNIKLFLWRGVYPSKLRYDAMI